MEFIEKKDFVQILNFKIDKKFKNIELIKEKKYRRKRYHF